MRHGAVISDRDLALAFPTAALVFPPAACCLVDDIAENAGSVRSRRRAHQIDRALPDPAPDGRSGSLPDPIGHLVLPNARPEPLPYVLASYDSAA